MEPCGVMRGTHMEPCGVMRGTHMEPCGVMRGTHMEPCGVMRGTHTANVYINLLEAPISVDYMMACVKSVI